MAQAPTFSQKFQSRYRVVRELGRGGMGRVFEAVQVNLERKVALKVLRPERFADVETRQRFVAEARILAKICHPNIVTLFDADLDEQCPYLVMEFVGGGTLRDLVGRRKGLPVDEALGVAGGLLAGLQHLHDCGVAHRDLKPENVLMQDGRVPKLVDFGLARAEGSGRLTAEGMMVGTPMYMSPEQLRGDVGGRQSDIYAFGMLLYHLLTGSHPIPLSAGWDVLPFKLKLTRADLRKGLQGVPDSIVDTIARCLKPAPDERFEAASQVAEALGVTQTSGRIPLSEVSPPSPAQTTRQTRWRRSVFVICALLAGLAAAVASMGGGAGPCEPEGLTVEAIPGGSRVRWTNREDCPGQLEALGRTFGSALAAREHVVEVPGVPFAEPAQARLTLPGEPAGRPFLLRALPLRPRPTLRRRGDSLHFELDLPAPAALTLEVLSQRGLAARAVLAPASSHKTRLALPDDRTDFHVRLLSDGRSVLETDALNVVLPAPRRSLELLAGTIQSLRVEELVAAAMRDARARARPADVERRLSGALEREQWHFLLGEARGAVEWALGRGGADGGLQAVVLYGLEQAMQIDQAARLAGLPAITGVRELLGRERGPFAGEPESGRTTAQLVLVPPRKVAGKITSDIRGFLLDDQLATQVDFVLELGEFSGALNAWVTLDLRHAIEGGIALVTLNPDRSGGITLALPCNDADPRAEPLTLSHGLDPGFLAPGKNVVRVQYGALPGAVVSSLLISRVKLTVQ
ncbi:MAG: serine/threonine protein kinase [Candidatus Wallbacteria bacterium]|nr:serine/threonine protein kinase [Candidatus Wallbacteria bacterium]